MADKDKQHRKGEKDKDKREEGKAKAAPRKDSRGGKKDAPKGKRKGVPKHKKHDGKRKKGQKRQRGLSMLDSLTNVIAGDDKRANEEGKSLLSVMTKAVGGNEERQDHRARKMLDALTRYTSSAEMWKHKEQKPWKSEATDTFRARLRDMHRTGRYPFIRIHDGNDVLAYGKRAALALRDYGNAIVKTMIVHNRFDGTVEMTCIISEMERDAKDRIVPRRRNRKRSI